MMDANQYWGVDEAIAAMRVLGRYDPWWIEEPTSPDDVLGHARIRREIAPIRVATGEHVQNRVIFKQLFQAEAIDVCQLDACRVGGVNEALAIILLAAKFGVPVCPHAGGVGLCEYVQHLAMFDYIAVSGTLEDRVVEWVDHLHEHFLHPAVVARGALPRADRTGLQHRDAARRRSTATSFRGGAAWNEPDGDRARQHGGRLVTIAHDGRQPRPPVGRGAHAAAVDDRGARGDRAAVRPARTSRRCSSATASIA